MRNIDDLSLIELKELVRSAHERIDFLEKTANLKNIVKIVNKQNYAWDIQDYTLNELKPYNISKITLDLYIDVCTFDSEDRSQCEVVGLSKYQNDWVSLMNCDYIPTKDEIELSPHDRDWYYSDDLLHGKAYMYMNIYYRKLPLPKADNFWCIDYDNNGDVVNVTRQCSQLHFDDGFVCHIDDWDDLPVILMI